MIAAAVIFAVWAFVATVLLVANHGAHKHPTPRHRYWER